jgi:Uma2 family endonuclease
MSTETFQTLMTADQFEAVAQQLGPCELVHGEVITLSPGGHIHGVATMNIGAALWNWARRTGLGRVLTGEPGLIVARTPDTVRGADVAYFSYERLPKGAEPRGFHVTPPNLVIEVVGKGQGWRDMIDKVGEYLRMGVDRVWVVDPDSRSVHVFRPDAEPLVMAENDTLSDEGILPGFSCRTADVFAE